jgi:hypothetical protein
VVVADFSGNEKAVADKIGREAVAYNVDVSKSDHGALTN